MKKDFRFKFKLAGQDTAISRIKSSALKNLEVFSNPKRFEKKFVFMNAIGCFGIGKV